MKLDFIGESFNGRSPAVDGQECVNLYPEIVKQNSKNQVILVGTPGKKLFVNVPTGVVRQLFASVTGRLFAVVGSQFVEILPNGTYNTLGTLITTQGYVSMAENTFQIIMVDGSAGYIYPLDNVNPFQQILFEGYQPGTHVVCVNGYFIQNVAGTATFIFSVAESLVPQPDGTLLNGLFWTIDEPYILADTIQAVSTINGEIWFTCGSSTQVWYNNTNNISSDPNNIWAPVTTAYINIGTIAPLSPATLGNTIFWLGSNEAGAGSVWASNGYLPQRISNHAIEYIIGQLKNPQSCVGLTMVEEGHQFYILIFVQDEKTLVYDLTTNMWHERGHWVSESGMNIADRMGSVATLGTTVYAGDRLNGNIYTQSLDILDDNGSEIMRFRTGPHVAKEDLRMSFHTFELDCQKGIGRSTVKYDSCGNIISTPEQISAGSPPVMLTWSDDSGFTWSSEHWASAGRTGAQKNHRVIWHRLGQSRDRVFRVRMSAPVKWILIGAFADVTVENR